MAKRMPSFMQHLLTDQQESQAHGVQGTLLTLNVEPFAERGIGSKEFLIP